MNGVLVVLEQRAQNGLPAWNRMSWEALAAGQKLAAHLPALNTWLKAGGHLLAISGRRDLRVPFEYVEHEANKLQALGIDVEVRDIDAGHDMILTHPQLWCPLAAQYLARADQAL